ncbi:MAG: hypothetical protein ACM3S2_07660 [Ignavibacteriales bacterium]
MIFTYPLIPKLIFRYANIPVTFLLLMYLFLSIVALRVSSLSLIPAFINIMLIYFVNRYYFRSYKIFPYKIEVDDVKMICSDFPFSNKIIQIKFEDIERITGSIFNEFKNKSIHIYDGKQNITIAFSLHLSKINELLTIILSKIRKEKSDELLAKLRQHNIERKREENII